MFNVQTDDFHNGFQMTFENGWTVSVQFGWPNYCSNQHKNGHVIHSSSDAEIAAWDKEGVWYRFANGDTVQGWNSADDVADFIAKVAEL
jgi:hypothetical protein